MSAEWLTDHQIAQLKAMPKRIKNPRAKAKTEGRRELVNYDVESQCGLWIFRVYKRQNTIFPNDYSCGISVVPRSSEVVTLARYNGDSHEHGNELEGTVFKYLPHIHVTTERYIMAGRKPDTYAEPTERYSTLDGALHCLLADWNIFGLETETDNFELEFE